MRIFVRMRTSRAADRNFPSRFTPTAAGTFTMTAVAVDNLNGQSNSNPVTIVATNPVTTTGLADGTGVGELLVGTGELVVGAGELVVGAGLEVVGAGELVVGAGLEVVGRRRRWNQGARSV